MSAYYNEFDPKAAAWLRELIAQGHIAPGDVDTRSITDVSPDDLRPYTQCHFFAGIGGWSYALRLAGAPDAAHAWTGSCPCQPFSAAGKGLGTADERHLWPAFHRLIRKCRPAIVFGEQVTSKAALGWLDGVFADMEGAGYACGAADLCAASVGAPHIRQRLWWVAYANSYRCGEGWQGESSSGHDGIGGNSAIGRLADSTGERLHGRQDTAGQDGRDGAEASGNACGVGNAASDDQRRNPVSRRHGEGITLGGPSSAGAGRMEHSSCDGRQQWRAEASGRSTIGRRCPWDSYDLLPCTDGKARRVESGTFPLAHGISGRVGLLRGYGNAIVPQVAAEFIQASFEALNDL